MTPPIRILVTDDHPFLRQIISQVLELQEDMIVVGKACNGAESVSMAHALHPDVVLMDYEMPDMGGVRATREILTENPHVAVIGFSAHEGDMVETFMREAGAAGYVSKNRDNAELLSAIREHAGKIV